MKNKKSVLLDSHVCLQRPEIAVALSKMMKSFNLLNSLIYILIALVSLLSNAAFGGYDQFVSHDCFGKPQEIEAPSAISSHGQWQETSSIFMIWKSPNIQYIEPVFRSLAKNAAKTKLNIVVANSDKTRFGLWFQNFQSRNQVTRNLNIILTQTQSTVFLRDPFVILWSKKQNREVFYLTPYIDPMPILYPQLKQSEGHDKKVTIEIARWCKRDVLSNDQDTNKYMSDATRGGNFVLFPGNFALTFDTRYRDLDLNDLGISEERRSVAADVISKANRSFDDHLNVLRSTVDDLIVRKNSFSSLIPNHSDEIFSVVRIKSQSHLGCDFAILVASPSKAYELLKKNEDDVRMSRDREVQCRNLYFYDLDGKQKSIPISTFDFQNDRRKIIDIAGSSLYVDDIQSNELIENSVMHNSCLGMSGRTLDNIYSDVQLRKFNMNASMEIQEHLNIIVKKIRETTSCRSPSIIEMPMIFQNNYDEPDHLLSNPVNGLAISPTDGPSYFFVPDPMTGIFRHYIDLKLDEFGIGHEYLKTPLLDHQGGNLHCVTNSY